MPTRCSRSVWAALLVAVSGFSSPVVLGAIRTSVGDHSLCCGPSPMMSVDGFPVRAHAQIAMAALPAASVATASSVGAAPIATSASTAAAPVGNEAQAQPLDAPIEQVDGYLKLGFERLAAFTFTPVPFDPAKPNEPPVSSADQIPQKIKDLDGKKAVVTGFMLPVRTDKGLVTEFLLMRDAMMCCYGVVPNINEWVIVKMTNGGVQALQDVPLAVYGKLQVKEQFENGYLSGIYLMEAEKASASAVAKPKS